MALSIRFLKVRREVSLMKQLVKHPPAMWEPGLMPGWEDWRRWLHTPVFWP